MSSGFASCILLLYALLFLQCASARKDDFLRIYDAKQDADNLNKDMKRMHVHEDDLQRKPKEHLHYHNSSSHMDHMDPELNIFFSVDDLWIGKTMPIYFPTKGPSTSPHLLPREEADSIPFSSSHLPYLLKYFSFSEDSLQAKAIENTLRQCELEPIKGETTFCATSLESMLDSTRSIFGLETKFKVLTTTHLTESATLLQNYTVLDTPKEIPAPKMVACHMMPYPYAVYFCHFQESENKLLKVSLGDENGGRVEAAAVCHMDTSQWDRDHVAFRVLGIQPGLSPVCHFFPADNLIWVPAPAVL